MPLTKGVYIGIRRRLQGETALLDPVPGGYRAQFDRLHPPHRESYGWHFFPKACFRELETHQFQAPVYPPDDHPVYGHRINTAHAGWYP